MALGGLIGFLIGISLGYAQSGAWPDVLWRSSVSALLAGVVLRWWGRLWANNLQAAQRERALRPEEAPTSSSAKKP